MRPLGTISLVRQGKLKLLHEIQAAANQVFSSAFWIVSVLPSVTATLVSKANAKGDKEELQDAVCQALIVGFGISLLGSALMLLYPERILSSVLKPGANAMRYARYACKTISSHCGRRTYLEITPGHTYLSGASPFCHRSSA